jgi:predicted amidophosphoribosyltransferase
MANLLFPTDCAGCGHPDTPLCPRCAPDPTTSPYRHSPTPRPAGLPPLWTLAPYAGPLRAALIAYKERHRRDLARPLADALTRVLAAAALDGAVSRRACGRDGGGGGSGGGSGGAGRVRSGGSAAGSGLPAPPSRSAPSSRCRVAERRPGRGSAPVVVVPVPSRRRAARERGGDHVLRLALGTGAVVCPVLRAVGRGRDSVGLSAAERVAGRRGGLAARAAQLRWLAALPRGVPVVLVDDLVTTGATLAEAAAVLRHRGVCVNAAATLMATERNHREGLV